MSLTDARYECGYPDDMRGERNRYRDEANTLHAKLAAVETERDTLRAALERIHMELSPHDASCKDVHRACYAHELAVHALAALDGAR